MLQIDQKNRKVGIWKRMDSERGNGILTDCVQKISRTPVRLRTDGSRARSDSRIECQSGDGTLLAALA